MLKQINIVIFLLLLLVTVLSADEISLDSISVNDSSKEESIVSDSIVSDKIYATAPEGDMAALFYETKTDKDKKNSLLNEELNKKRKVMIIGNVVLATSLALEYGVLLPASLDIDPDNPDMTDQIALLSPQILGFMMKTAGTTMTTMRTSEAIDSYVSITGDSDPANLSWKLYWASWGATLFSGLIGTMVTVADYVPELEEYKDGFAAASMGVAIAGDCIRVANGIYSMLLIKKMKGKAVAIPVRVTPSVGSNGEPGLSMKIKF